MEMETHVEIHRPRPSRKLVPFGSEFGALINLEKSVSQIAVIEGPYFTTEADVRSSVNRIAFGTIIGEQPWREMLAADKAKVIDLPSILSAQIDLYNSRLHAIDARSPPDAGRLRVVARQLVPVLRHRQHPHGAERGNHRDIHDDPHGPIPRFTVGELRLLARSSGRERKSCGCGFQATKARIRFVRRAYPPCQRHRDAGVALALREHRHTILSHTVR